MIFNKEAFGVQEKLKNLPQQSDHRLSENMKKEREIVDAICVMPSSCTQVKLSKCKLDLIQPQEV